MYASLKLIVCTVTIAIVFVVCPQTHAVVITASTSLPMSGGVHQVAQNTSFTVDLNLSGWGVSDGQVDTIAFNLGFNTSLFAYTSATVDTSGAFINDNQQGGATVTGNPNTSNTLGGVWGFEVALEREVRAFSH